MKQPLFPPFRLLLLLVACLYSASAWAQSSAVSGRVTAREGGALPGATVLERGTSNGVSTNAEGTFSLNVQPNATLVISSVGYTSQTIVVGSQSVINASLAASTTQLSEAIVVGYGTTSKQDLTGSVAQVSGREVANAPVPSFEQALQGKAAGVFIENSSGKLGQGIKVRVRGTSSISNDTQPLYVVDGIPVISENLSGNGAATNPIADLNPNDIESISILKDASASAIYGSRASNGVVLITTKRGKSGNTRLTLGYQTGLSTPTHKKEYLNSAEFVEMAREAGASVGYQTFVENRLKRYSAGTDFANSAVESDWQSEAFQRAPFGQYDLGLSGGNDKTRFFLSGLYSDQKGILIGNRFEKIGARVNLDHKATDKITVGLNFNLSRTRNFRVSNDNAFSTPLQIVALAPITPIIDPRTGLASGALDLATGRPNSNYPTYYNPYLNFLNASYLATVYRTLGNVFGQYEFLPGLSFRTEIGLDLLEQVENQYSGRLTGRNSGFSNNGSGFNRHVTSARYTTNNFFTYRKVLNEVHTIEAVLGTSYEERKINSNSVQGQQFPSDAYRALTSSALINGGTSTESRSALVSYFTRVNYAYANKYLLSLSARIDGSSRFGINKRYGVFPAASIGWVVTEEPFLKNQKILSLLKPRISIGQTGNQGIGDFASRSLFSGDAGYAGQPGQRPFQLGNPDLKWETTTQADAGIEFGFIDNRINLEVDVYQKKTNDLALNVNVPGTSGFTRQFRNVGNLENRGLEFALTTRNLVGDFTWNTNFNASTNRNKITNTQGQVIEGGYVNRAVEGQPIGVFYTVEYAGVDPKNGDALYWKNAAGSDDNGNIDHSTGTTSDYTLANRVVFGNPNPKWTGGVTNSFGYKGIDFSFAFQGVFGNKIYRGAGQYEEANFSQGFDNQTKDQLRRWRKPGDITDVPEARLFPDIANGTDPSSRYISDGSYVRLKNVTLGYNFPAALVQKAKLASVRLYVSGVNLKTYTAYKGWDPEVNADYLAATGNIAQGNDFYSAPQAKTFTVGVNVGF